MTEARLTPAELDALPYIDTRDVSRVHIEVPTDTAHLRGTVYVDGEAYLVDLEVPANLTRGVIGPFSIAPSSAEEPLLPPMLSIPEQISDSVKRPLDLQVMAWDVGHKP